MAKPSERTTPNARPQMADIARMAGVSESTVSRALAGSPVVAERTRAYIKQIATEAGYQVDPVARSLRAKRSNTVSVAVPMMHALDQPLSDPFLMTMLALLAEELTGRGYSMLLSKLDRHQDGWVEQLARGNRSDGVIVLGQSSEHAALDQAAREGLPLAVWGSRIDGQAYISVGSDNFQGGDFNNADVLRVKYTEDYSATLVPSDDPSTWKLALKAKNDNTAYDAINLWIRKKDQMPVRGEYFGTSGQLLRSATFSDFTEFEKGYTRPAKVEMRNELVKSRRSELVMKKLSLSVDAPAQRFTQTDLGR